MSAHKKSNRIRYMIITNTNVHNSALSGDVIFMRHIRHLKKKKWYSNNIRIKKLTKCVFKTIKKNNLIHCMPKVSVSMPMFKITTPNSNYRIFSPNRLKLNALKGN